MATRKTLPTSGEKSTIRLGSLHVFYFTQRVYLSRGNVSKLLTISALKFIKIVFFYFVAKINFVGVKGINIMLSVLS